MCVGGRIGSLRYGAYLRRRDHLDAVSAQLFVERIAVIGAISNQIRWLGLDHVEVGAQLHQANFMVVGGVGACRQRQAMAINNRHAGLVAPPLVRREAEEDRGARELNVTSRVRRSGASVGTQATLTARRAAPPK